MDEATKIVGELIERYTGNDEKSEALKKNFEDWKVKYNVNDAAADEVLDILVGWI